MPKNISYPHYLKIKPFCKILLFVSIGISKLRIFHLFYRIVILRNNLFRTFSFIFVLFSVLKLYIVHIGRILDSPIYLRMTMLDFFVAFSTFSSSLSFPKVSIGNLNLAIVYIQIPSFEGMTR